MVSTRSLKYKFTEGEKVLCYEPDPLKSKVLYNSKVLAISVKKDDTGKKVVHFLIHFQGWNATWDRFVTEEYVLKDTEENRQLQKHLAQTAQLTAKAGCCRGGNLYKRERKKRSRKLTEGGAEGKRSAPPPAHDDSDISEADDALSLTIPPSLKAFLELDFHLITQQNKVLNLPAVPNAVSILEMYVKDYARGQMRQACNRKTHFRAASAAGSHANITLEGFCRNMNLCREVVDGLRVYLDFMLATVLLYNQERGQYQEAMTVGLTRQPLKIKEEVEENGPSLRRSVSVQQPLAPPCGGGVITNTHDDEVEVVVEIDRRRSLRSHTGGSDHPTSNGRSIVTRHSSADSARHDNGVKSEGGSRSMSAKETDVLNRILSWKLVPDKVAASNPTMPSLIYGAAHLARLFVKLPEVIQQASQTESRNNLLLDYLANFMKYLEDHPEWFGPEHYRENIYRTGSTNHEEKASTTTANNTAPNTSD